MEHGVLQELSSPVDLNTFRSDNHFNFAQSNLDFRVSPQYSHCIRLLSIVF